MKRRVCLKGICHGYVRQSARQCSDRSVDRRQVEEILRRRPVRRHRPSDREQGRVGRQRHRRGRQSRARCRAGRVPRLGRQEPARARRNPAQILRAHHARRRTAGEAHHHRERQGAVGLAWRSRLCRGILPLVRRRSGAQCRPVFGGAVDRRAHSRASQTGRHRRAGHAVEFPGGNGDAQDRPGARRRLSGRAQAGVGYAAHHARSDADPRRSRRAGRRGQCHSIAVVRQGRVRHAARSARPRGVVHRLDRSRPQTPARSRRLDRQTGDGTWRQRALHRVRRCRYRRGDRRRDDRQDAQYGRGLHRRQSLLRAREGARRVCQKTHRQRCRA